MITADIPKLYNREQVAAMFGLSSSTVNIYLREGKIPCTRICKKVVFTEEQIGAIRLMLEASKKSMK